MSILEQSHGLRNSVHLYSFTSSLVFIYIYYILELATVYIHEQVTDQIFSHEAFTFSIVVIYILGGFNVFGVMYINLNPKVLAAALEF